MNSKPVMSVFVHPPSVCPQVLSLQPSNLNKIYKGVSLQHLSSSIYPKIHVDGFIAPGLRFEFFLRPLIQPVSSLHPVDESVFFSFHKQHCKRQTMQIIFCKCFYRLQRYKYFQYFLDIGIYANQKVTNMHYDPSYLPVRPSTWPLLQKPNRSEPNLDPWSLRS